MASKRSAAALIAVAFLLPSCVLTRRKSVDGVESSKRSELESKPQKSSRTTSSRQRPIEVSTMETETPPIEPNFDLNWETTEFNLSEDDGAFEVRRNRDTGHEALMFRGESFDDINEGGEIKSSSSGGVKLAKNGDWLEYRFSLRSDHVARFNYLPLVIYGDIETSILSSGSYSPAKFDLVVNGQSIDIVNQMLYMDMGLEPCDEYTQIFWNSESMIPLVEGTNTIRYTRTGSANLFIQEFWITDYSFRLQPYL
ncbi:MAG: hypothetical protein K6B51_00760 [Bacilli bacterium]|nr:hypothetical protein [Bacilli bacterium]